jgi:hypothetical protein
MTNQVYLSIKDELKLKRNKKFINEIYKNVSYRNPKHVPYEFLEVLYVDKKLAITVNLNSVKFNNINYRDQRRLEHLCR